ncbi:MFS transporter [Haliangium ochraceum]|uniref:Major facilitator superfamily MFS_1 n=1 Tax=Haliangium ochraceum (strain DSM 14365 / JCM 11303 / SMP-2) TaxID=502025 RepID=D0LQ87_HALO1|nr:MFS transporter [Haliangium ochraceum]ACY18896.1 major facilitator superfamily MFS_1 [Haliangium ochraceum DSM 14365]
MSMQSIKRQYLFAFAVNGAALPYLPVFLEERLADRAQVGDVLGLTGVAFMITPVLMTLLADARVQNRKIIGVLFALTAAASFLLALSHGFVAIALAYALFSLAFWPQMSLQDGLTFAVLRSREALGLPFTPYHRVRIYGTLGFILPALGLFLLMRGDSSAALALVFGGAVAVLGVGNAFSLPFVEPAARSATGKGARLPTLGAARKLLRGPGLVMCLGMFAANLAAAAYYGFYPIYLTSEIGFSEEWVGIVTILGVIIELGVMAAVGAMVRAWGMRWTMVIGLACMVVRMIILAAWPTPFWAVATQIFHGMMVIAVHVLPPMYLDSLAHDSYRSSIQGLYTMLVIGLTRIVGSLVGGRIAEASLLDVFTVSAVVTAAAMLLFIVLFRDQPSENDATAAQSSPPRPRPRPHPRG